MHQSPSDQESIPFEFMEIIAEYARINDAHRIRPSDRIVHDLDILGDDADEMGWEIEAKFGVKFDDFELKEFIPGEGSILRSLVITNLFLRFHNYKPLTVMDLWKLVRRKKWGSTP